MTAMVDNPCNLEIAERVAMGTEHLKSITIQLPAEIVHAVDKRFPAVRHAVHRKANANLRSNLLYQIYRALHDPQASFSVHQDLINQMYGQRHRQKLMAAIKELPCFRLSKQHVAGHRCQVWTVEHPTLRSEDRGIIYGPSPVTSVPMSYFRPHYLFVPADCIAIGIEGRWLKHNREQYEIASSKLWSVSHRYRGHLETSLSNTVIQQVTLSDCLEAARRSDLSVWTAEQKARHYHQQWGDFADDPLAFCFRKAGRLYYGLVNQPKSLRRQFIQFRWGGDIVPTAEIDLSSSYWAFLLAMLPPGDDVDVLAKDLEDGLVYERLASACTTQQWPDRRKLKVAVQVQCLFGQDGFGKQPLWGALSTRYPTLARYVAAVRLGKGHVLRQDGARELSRLLTTAEGAFFIDRLLADLASKGIPALPIHDAVIVPAPVAETVRAYAEAAIRKLGIPGRFHVTM